MTSQIKLRNEFMAKNPKRSDKTNSGRKAAQLRGGKRAGKGRKEGLNPGNQRSIRGAVGSTQLHDQAPGPDTEKGRGTKRGQNTQKEKKDEGRPA